MPELPEVETVCRGLQQYICGKKIEQVTLYRPDLRFPFPEKLVEQLKGKQVQSIHRRAKYLIFLIGDVTLIGHLGMSGKYIIREQTFPRHKHDHMIWQLEGKQEVAYHDPRRFGFLLMTESESWQQHPLIISLGKEPFDEECSAEYLAEKMVNKTMPIKQWLMDHHIIVGIGNIYASETLFRCGIHPASPAKNCIPYAAQILAALRQVLQEAIASGGSTLRNYANAAGDSGYFQHHFAVYAKEGKPCQRCSANIHRIVQSGRSTFFCPTCQPEKPA